LLPCQYRDMCEVMTEAQKQPSKPEQFQQQEDTDKPSKDFQRFDEVVSKLFRVPVEEVRDLEQEQNSQN
jgi:hypothetical protein